MTVLELYNIWRKHTFFISKGFYPSSVKSIENIKNQDQLIYFEKFLKMIDRNDGMIDPDIYIAGLAEFYKGWFDPKILSSPKSIKIYQTKINILNSVNDKKEIYKGFLKSIKFVQKYCKKNEIKDFDDYVFENSNLFPTILKHYLAGSITDHFLCMIPNIKVTLKTFPKDMVDECINEFLERYNIIRNKTISIKKIRKIKDFNKFMTNLL